MRWPGLSQVGEAISIGQSNIEQDRSKVGSLHLCQRIAASRGSCHEKAVMFEEVMSCGQDIWIVIDNQDSRMSSLTIHRRLFGR